MGSAIEYDDHRIDETAQIILRILRDTGRRATAGELRKEAGLDETNPVHYRAENHLGPTGLVERAGRRERPGGAQDEVVYKLTEEGAAFVDTHENELTNAIAASEAVETLRRIRATVGSYDERVSVLEAKTKNWRRWKNRWSTRVGRVEDTAAEIEEEQEDQSSGIMWNERELKILERRIDNIKGRIGILEDRADGFEGRLQYLEGEMSARPKYEKVEEDMRSLRHELSSDIEDVREDAQGIF